MVLKKSSLKLARRIWSVQKRHPRKRFVANDFTSTGRLTRQGLRKIR